MATEFNRKDAKLNKILIIYSTRFDQQNLVFKGSDLLTR